MSYNDDFGPRWVVNSEEVGSGVALFLAVAAAAVVRVWRVLCDPGLRGLVVPRGASGVVDVEEVVTERVMGGL